MQVMTALLTHHRLPPAGWQPETVVK